MEVVNILALILALIGGFKLMDHTMTILMETFGKPHPFLPFMAFMVVFIGIILGVHILGRALKGLIGLTILGSIDKFAGALVGLVKWAFAISIVLWLVDSFSPGLFDNYTGENAILFPLLLAFAPHVFFILVGFLPFLKEMMESIRELLTV